MSKYMIMNKSSRLSRWGTPRCRHVALVELEDGWDTEPAMISERARGVKRIIDEFEGYIGYTSRSYGYRLLEEWRRWIEKAERGEAVPELPSF